jgi:hypothetical protein
MIGTGLYWQSRLVGLIISWSMKKSNSGQAKRVCVSQSFTPRKKVKFVLEGLAAGVQEVKLEASVGVQSLLKPRRPVA